MQGNLKPKAKQRKTIPLTLIFSNYQAEHWDQETFEWRDYMRKFIKFHLCAGKSSMKQSRFGYKMEISDCFHI
jgi:hypothetical protein